MGGYAQWSSKADKPAGKAVGSADKSNLGGTAPGAVVAFIGSKGGGSQARAADNTNVAPGARINPVMHAATVMHVGLADEAPDTRRNVPIHPGLQPGLFRTARDANPIAPRGMENDPTANDGRPLSPDGRHRGESPEIPTQNRMPKGPYVR